MSEAGSRFTDDEWRSLAALPELVVAAVSLTDGAGPVSTLREALAGAGAIKDAAKRYPNVIVIQEILGETAIDPGDRIDPRMHVSDNLSDPKQAAPMALATAKAAAAALEKTSPEEAAAYRDWIDTIARTVARADKSGGFLGIGGVKVNPHEASFLSELIAALGR